MYLRFENSVLITEVWLTPVQQQQDTDLQSVQDVLKYLPESASLYPLPPKLTSVSRHCRRISGWSCCREKSIFDRELLLSHTSQRGNYLGRMLFHTETSPSVPVQSLHFWSVKWLWPSNVTEEHEVSHIWKKNCNVGLKNFSFS